MALSLETIQTSMIISQQWQCSVCRKLLKDPRTLPCLHSFCKACLEDIVQACPDKAPDGRRIRESPCPNCGQSFTIDSRNQIPDVRQNHFICNLVEEATIQDESHETADVPCSHECTEGPSIARCLTCKKFLCKECLAVHNKYRGHSNHSVLTMKELTKPENRTKLREKIYCNEHQGETLIAYCQTCDKLVCKKCMDGKHARFVHSRFLVQNLAGSCRTRLALENQAMHTALFEGYGRLGNLLLANSLLDSDVESVKRDIEQQKDSVIAQLTGMIEQKAAMLLDEVDSIYSRERLRLAEPTENAKEYVENMHRSVQLSRKLIESGTGEEIVSSYKMLSDNADTLLRKCPNDFWAPVHVAKLSYTSCIMEPSSEEINAVLADFFGVVKANGMYKL
ncbi:E3 ubiquitin-protein ligase TRIM33-like [Dendronephthya gigantea]|uniref:E3 ubiquitin-protein ligase TRIM33-like n=1 Tax=Dendronephthya gigantea TaxID=151771 RepID=UPI00106AEF58|nr:E3 ubiquitin-protein ligase TRIM33-like [Dendronephthya gigantea]